MAKKIDFKKELKHLYTAKPQPALVDVPPMQYLVIDGQGAPGGAAFQEAMGALYGAAYTIKFGLKKAGSKVEYAIGVVEGLWWVDEGEEMPPKNREAWRWTVMIATPDHITAKDLAVAKKALAAKGQPDASRVRLETLKEGRCAQNMHIGPYSTVGEVTIPALYKFIAEQGLSPCGKHHEIWLNDPRRTAPEKLKTIIRHPVG